MRILTDAKLVAGGCFRTQWGLRQCLLLAAVCGTLLFGIAAFVWQEVAYLSFGHNTRSSKISVYRTARAYARVNQEQFWLFLDGQFSPFQGHLFEIREHVPADARVLYVLPHKDKVFHQKSFFWLYPRKLKIITVEQAEQVDTSKHDYFVYYGRTPNYRELRAQWPQFTPVRPTLRMGARGREKVLSAILIKDAPHLKTE